jgi:hypothetical protein
MPRHVSRPRVVASAYGRPAIGSNGGAALRGDSSKAEPPDEPRHQGRNKHDAKLAEDRRRLSLDRSVDRTHLATTPVCRVCDVWARTVGVIRLGAIGDEPYVWLIHYDAITG